MTRLLKSLKNNFFILIIGVIYIFSFSKLSIGDCFYRSLENSYPLFYRNPYGAYPIWFGFEPAHLLPIPTLRAIQVFIANFGFLPNALLLTQLVNMLLALCTIKLAHSSLLRLNVGNTIANTTTIIFAFSYGFYANMNGEIHHFSIFLFAVIIWLLLKMEGQEKTKGSTIFIISLCLALMPLFHLETIIFSVMIIIYIIYKKDLRTRFTKKPCLSILGIAIIPAILVALAIVFHYFEAGSPDLSSYTTNYLLPCWRLKTNHNLLVKATTSITPASFYIMSRAYLESFSIISRLAKTLQHYKDVVFYSNTFLVNSSVATTAAYFFSFLSVVIIGFYLAIKTLTRATTFIWFLAIMLIVYLFSFGILISSVFFLSEFFIIAVMIQCILLGYLFNSGRKWHKAFFYTLVIMTIFSNIAFFIYPQKVSAKSIAAILNEIRPSPKSNPETAIFRVGFFDFPYPSEMNGKIKIYFDEHAYDSKENTLKQIGLIDNEFKQGKRVLLISPGFLFGEGGEVNIKSVLPVGMDHNPHLVGNLQLLLDTLKKNYRMNITKKHYYNFATLGQLGKLAVVELQVKIE